MEGFRYIFVILFLVGATTLIQDGLCRPLKRQKRSLDQIFEYVVDFGETSSPYHVKRDQEDLYPTDEHKSREFHSGHHKLSLPDLHNENEKRVNEKETDKQESNILEIPVSKKSRGSKGQEDLSTNGEKWKSERQSSPSINTKKIKVFPSDLTDGWKDEGLPSPNEEYLQNLPPADEDVENENEIHQPFKMHNIEMSRELDLLENVEEDDEDRKGQPLDHRSLKELNLDDKEEEKRENYSPIKYDKQITEQESNLPEHIEMEENKWEGRHWNHDKELRELNSQGEVENEKREIIPAAIDEYETDMDEESNLPVHTTREHIDRKETELDDVKELRELRAEDVNEFDNEDKKREMHAAATDHMNERKREMDFPDHEEIREEKQKSSKFFDYKRESKNTLDNNEDKDEEKEINPNSNQKDNNNESEVNIHKRIENENESKESYRNHGNELRELGDVDGDENGKRDIHSTYTDYKKETDAPKNILDHKNDLRRLYSQDENENEERQVDITAHKHEAKRDVLDQDNQEQKDAKENHQKELRELHPPELDEEEERDPAYEEIKQKKTKENIRSNKASIKRYPLNKIEAEDEEEYQIQGEDREDNQDDDQEEDQELQNQFNEEREETPGLMKEADEEEYQFTPVSNKKESYLSLQHRREKEEQPLDPVFHEKNRRNAEKIKRLFHTLALMKLTRRNNVLEKEMDDFPFTKDENARSFMPRVSRYAAESNVINTFLDHEPIRAISDEKVHSFNDGEATTKRNFKTFRRYGLDNSFAEKITAFCQKCCSVKKCWMVRQLHCNCN